jgi:lipoate-protein ligase A
MALDDREWRLIREESWDGPLNMALDEIAAETAAEGGPRTVRVYQWDPSTLSLGYRQDEDTVAWDYCDREGISVTRRPTGGGGIYHDRYGDISYSIVAPADELPGDLMPSSSTARSSSTSTPSATSRRSRTPRRPPRSSASA